LVLVPHELREPPHNADAEHGLIGSALLDPDTIDEAATLVPRGDRFYRDDFGKIWSAMLAMRAAGQPIDPLTVADHMGPKLGGSGGFDVLAEILDRTPHAANAGYYAAIVRDKAMLRDLIEVANEILREGYARNLAAADQVERAAEAVFALQSQQTRSRLATTGEIVPEVLELIEARREGRMLGLGTGFDRVDEFLLGLKPECVYVVAARPAMGKSAFGAALCDHASVEFGVPSLFVSLEMPREQVVERLAVARARIDGKMVQAGRIAPADAGRWAESLDAIRRAPIHIDDTPGLSIMDIAAIARRLKAREGIGLAVIDYLQLIQPGDDREARQEQVARISRRLKTLARELKIPIVALAQLSRKVEDREDKTPRLADLRESGAIEQDADVVIFLSRPAYYDPNDRPGICQVIFGKNRHGATGLVELQWEARSAAFGNLAAVNPDFGAAPAF
jgi:replicative DNA helicase